MKTIVIYQSKIGLETRPTALMAVVVEKAEGCPCVLIDLDLQASLSERWNGRANASQSTPVTFKELSGKLPLLVVEAGFAACVR